MAFDLIKVMTEKTPETITDEELTMLRKAKQKIVKFVNRAETIRYKNPKGKQRNGNLPLENFLDWGAMIDNVEKSVFKYKVPNDMTKYSFVVKLRSSWKKFLNLNEVKNPVLGFYVFTFSVEYDFVLVSRFDLRDKDEPIKKYKSWQRKFERMAKLGLVERYPIDGGY